MTREALKLDQGWLVRFSVQAVQAAFQVGVVMANGEEIMTEAHAEGGNMVVELDAIEGTPAAVAIDLVEGPEQVAIDDVLIVGM